MTDDLKQKIKIVAVDHFDRDGYHGTTIRNIARDVGCSLPMVYYYYQNKSALFHEIIKEDYFSVLKKLAAAIQTIDVLEYYTQFVFQINDISEYERKIYRLGIKVYLGFDGDEELTAVMDKWEQSILPRHYELLMPSLSGRENPVAVVRALVHLLENLIERIVVKNQRISQEEVREELEVILGR
jgi:AcrR family transcriptional regulator